jgi:transmembrane sensor
MMTFDERMMGEERLPEELQAARAQARSALRNAWQSEIELAAVWERVRASGAQENLSRRAQSHLESFVQSQTGFAGPQQTQRHFGPRTLRATTVGLGVGALAMILGLAYSAGIGTHFGIQPSSSAEYATVAGQRATITLPDGSTAMLAPQSRLRYDYRTGSSGERAVRLDGEALFTVTKATATPFTVYAGDVSTRVLGTTFGVRRYTGDNVTSVVVVSGRVFTRGPSGSVALSAGESARVTDSTVSTADLDVRSHTAWTRGELIFSRTPVPTMLATLSRWYGYEFRLADSTLATRHVTAVFKASAMRETLSELEELLEVTMRFDGKTVTLRARPRTRQENRQPNSQRMEVGR